MSLDLHAEVSHLPRAQRVAYGLGLVVGIGGLFLFVLALAVEVLTTPGSRVWLGLTLPAAAYSCWHVVREVRGHGAMPALRWVVFFGAVASLCFNAATTIRDPVAGVFFVGVGVVSASMILGARLIARRALPPGSVPD